MLAARGAVGLFLLALWLYCIVDVITTDESQVRHLPKLLWLVIVLFIPDIGSIIWLVAGRPEKASLPHRRPGLPTRPRRPLGPEDQANFGVDLDGLSPIVREREEQAQLRLREEQLRRREQELARKEREAELQRREDELRRRERELGDVEPPSDPPPPIREGPSWRSDTRPRTGPDGDGRGRGRAGPGRRRAGRVRGRGPAGGAGAGPS